MLNLILLPGMDGTGGLFEPFIAALPDGCRAEVVRYPTDQPLGYEALSAIAREALPVDENYVIVSESFSGPIAITLAAEKRPNLKGLVLCCTFARNPRPLLSTVGALVAGRPIPRVLLAFALLGQFGDEPIHRALADAVACVRRDVMRERMRAVQAVDVSFALRSIQVPCLYLRASHDRVVPPRASAHINTWLPTTKIVEITGPHCLLQAAPVATADAILAFVRELQSSPQS